MPHLLVALSAHGFGHAAQTAPVVNELRRRLPRLRLTLRTDLPRHFLATRFCGDFEVVPGPGDFGMVMDSALAVAREQSAARYAALHARWDAVVAQEAEQLTARRPDLVVSNVSYLVPAAARAAGIPALVLASFNWAQVYAHYFAARPEAAQVLAQMRAGYAAAEAILALEPGIPMTDPAVVPAGLVVSRGRSRRAELQERLGLEQRKRLVLVSLGGVDQPIAFHRWPEHPDIHWLISSSAVPTRPDMTGLERPPFPFPDLLASADALVTKPGYGSFTEAACSGVPVLYVRREDWPEEPYLIAWMERHGRALVLASDALAAGELSEPLRRLWSLVPVPPVVPTGVQFAAGFLHQRLRALTHV